jgi:hypothetical protein
VVTRAAIGVVLVASTAAAGPPVGAENSRPATTTSAARPGPNGAVMLGEIHTVAGDAIATELYLNRCSGGCAVHGSAIDDAATHASSLPCSGGGSCGGGACFCTSSGTGTFTIDEFVNDAGQAGAAADAEWAAFVQCMKEVYSPFGVKITDQLPANGVTYNEAIVAGIADNIGYSQAQLGGIAHVSSTCTPQNDIMSFSFANEFHGPGRINTICAVASQETAHSYGLDHEYSFPGSMTGGPVDQNGASACTDPMSYRGDCGGQRFFRNQPARCGEYGPRACNCGGTQNSHLRILAAAGSGTPITRPPMVTIATPTAGAAVAAGQQVIASAGAQRGIARLELWLNGYDWATVPGLPWGADGQPDPGTYQLAFPAGVPDGVIDVVVKAYDDVPVETDSATVTVTKGAPCTSAATCATGQQCDASGRCFWAPPTGMLGEACTYPQFCTSGLCDGPANDQICTQSCIVGAADGCPMGYDCLMTDGVNGICFPHGAGGGCCDAGTSAAGPAALSALVAGLALRRRRRR